MPTDTFHTDAPSPNTRFWELDLLRGVAVILMIGFHWSSDLAFLSNHPPQSFWLFTVWQRVVATLFLTLAGISLWLKHSKSQNSYRPLCYRGLTVLLLGGGITVVTRLFLPNGFIVFGVLHLIGLATIVSYPFFRLGNLNLLLAVVIILGGAYLQNFRFSFPWLLWVGLIPQEFSSYDYFPLLPWFGLILLGIYLGKVFYRNNTRRLPLGDCPMAKTVRCLCWLGRRSLPIYLLHQPLLLGLLFLIKKLGY